MSDAPADAAPPEPAPAYRLPLFPLPLVLFPGAAVPLHIFEPRYRRLLADVQAGDGRFGIVVAEPGGPSAGLVGCEAQVRDVEQLPDGRSNLVVDGGARFALVRLLDTEAPYAVAEVVPYADRGPATPNDEGAGAALESAAARVRTLFRRVARAAGTLADDEGPTPELPDEGDLGFAVAARVDFELPARQRVLAARSELERLELVAELLERGVTGVEARAELHTRARSNGHGPHA